MSWNQNKAAWIAASGFGALAGAVVAMKVFPAAAFAANPTGHFGWHLVGFAVAVGTPFAIFQWAALQFIARPQQAVQGFWTVLWLPVTILGIAAIMLPLWWVDAYVLLFQPYMTIVIMLPGGIILGAGQYLVLTRLGAPDGGWLLGTIIGVAIGGVFGLVVAIWIPLPIEHTWAFLFGISVGAFQSRPLARFTENPAE